MIIEEISARGMYADCIDSAFVYNLVKAAPMHDIGKITISDEILQKPGKLSDAQFEEMKKHSEKGAEIVEKLLEGIDDPTFVEITKNVANYHHEKWNGAGYPEGLSGEEIPIEARIMALADVFDALVSKRCYKEKMDYDRAFEIIEESSGSHFEPRLAEIFMTCRPQLEEYYNLVED
jgi:response regulator RpfG family c-di-GMP phosphodiesterase